MSGGLAAVRPKETAADDDNRVRRAVDRAVRAVARAIVEETEGVRPLPAALVRRIRTRDAVYHVHGSLLGSRNGQQTGDHLPAVLVVVERTPPEPPSTEEIRLCLGLTRKEAAVARLLAEGRTNTEIARRLYISQHTARHHTENLMAKLGFRSRTEVAEAVLTAGAELELGAGDPVRAAL